MQHTNTHIFTNREENTLIKEFQGVLENNRQIRNLDAVVGFLRASGYFSLRPLLDSIGRVKVGASLVRGMMSSATALA